MKTNPREQSIRYQCVRPKIHFTQELSFKFNEKRYQINVQEKVLFLCFVWYFSLCALQFYIWQLCMMMTDYCVGNPRDLFKCLKVKLVKWQADCIVGGFYPDCREGSLNCWFLFSSVSCQISMTNSLRVWQTVYTRNFLINVLFQGATACSFLPEFYFIFLG